MTSIPPLVTAVDDHHDRLSFSIVQVDERRDEAVRRVGRTCPPRDRTRRLQALPLTSGSASRCCEIDNRLVELMGLLSNAGLSDRLMKSERVM